MAVEIRALEPGDDRSSFHSGDPDLDRFFRRFAGQNQFRHHVGVTYIAVDRGNVVAFMTVAACHLEVDDLPFHRRGRLPSYPLPTLRLARLAVSEASQGQGIGALLLRAACELAERMAASVGCVGLVVDAKPGSVAFYERYGFESLAPVEGALGDRPRPIPMFLGLQEIPPV